MIRRPPRFSRTDDLFPHTTLFRARFLGRLTRSEMLRLVASSDVLLSTSLQDSFGSVVLEAMAAGVPVLTIDHQGVGTRIPGNAAIKVPPTDRKRTRLNYSH